MFIDWVEIEVLAGSGGDGLVAWRREKFVAKGGPAGGDGGQGGSVVIKANSQDRSLAKFRFLKIIRAANGQPGRGHGQHGRAGEDQLVSVPPGTVVKISPDQVLADLTQEGQTVIVAQGGVGGFGNAHFKSSRRRAPAIAEKGIRGQRQKLTLELKLLADIGLVGLPNAGKSSFLRAVSQARPRVADYPFTTLEPHLGVAEFDQNKSILFADIPGLIKGAHLGKGLGHQFLRHLERNRHILHLVDSYLPDPVSAWQQVQEEVAAYSSNLAKIKQTLALTKIDGRPPALVEKIKNNLATASRQPVWLISSQAKLGLTELLRYLNQQLAKTPQPAVEKEESLPPVVFGLPKNLDPKDFVVKKLATGQFLVLGDKIEYFAAKTHFDNFYGRQRLIDIIIKLGIKRRLESLGYDGQEIIFGQPEIGRLSLLEVDED